MRHKCNGGLRRSAPNPPYELTPKTQGLPPARTVGFATLRDFGAVLRGLVAFASARLTAAFLATLVDVMDVLSAIAFAHRCLRYPTLQTVPRAYAARTRRIHPFRCGAASSAAPPAT